MKRIRHNHRFLTTAGLLVAERGATPSLTKYGVEHRSLDTLQLTPSLYSLQQRNRKTVARLLPALAIRQKGFLNGNAHR